MWCSYNAVSFLKTPDKRYPIAHVKMSYGVPFVITHPDLGKA